MIMEMGLKFNENFLMFLIITDITQKNDYPIAGNLSIGISIETVSLTVNRFDEICCSTDLD